MPRPWSLPALCVCVALFAVGCSRPAVPQLLPGDVVRPEVWVAPKAPWSAGAKVSISALARVERAGKEPHYLNDDDVPLELMVMHARVTFLDGDRVLGDPFDLPLAHDC